MKSSILVTLFFFLVCWEANSQTITVSDGVNFKSAHKYAIIGKMKDHILLYQEKDNDFEIQAYNDKMGISWEKELELEKKKPQPIEVVGFDDHFYVIYRFKQKGEHLVKVHKYNAAANLVDSTTVTSYGKRFTVPDPELIISENKETVLLVSTEFYSKLEFTAFSLREMKVLWEATYAPEDLNNGYHLQQIVVDNIGAMHMIINRENERIKKDKPHYFDIWSRYPDKDQIITSKIELEGKLTYDVYFQPDNLNNTLTAGGLYSEKNKARTQGYYYLQIPYGEPSAYQLYFHEFEEAFMEELVENKSKVTKGLFDIEVQDLAIRRDGGILLIGEQRKELDRRATNYISSYYSNDQVQVAADYFYEDLFILSIHPNGEKHWEKILHKKQYSQGDDAAFSSFFMAKTPKQLRLVYNDEVRNEGIVNEYLVRGNGGTDRKSVLNTEDQDLKLRLRESLQVAHNEIVVPSELKSKLKLVRVVY